MKWLAKLIIAVLVNVAILLLLSRWIPDFSTTAEVMPILTIAAALTALNYFVKPLLKLLLGPLIIITLGLGLIVVNAVILFLLDFFFAGLTIGGTVALVEATLVFGVLNFIFHLATKRS